MAESQKKPTMIEVSKLVLYKSIRASNMPLQLDRPVEEWEPIIVCGFNLVGGLRRVQLAKKLGLTHIPSVELRMKKIELDATASNKLTRMLKLICRAREDEDDWKLFNFDPSAMLAAMAIEACKLAGIVSKPEKQEFTFRYGELWKIETQYCLDNFSFFCEVVG